jgi:hypothetical protein
LLPLDAWHHQKVPNITICTDCNDAAEWPTATSVTALSQATGGRPARRCAGAATRVETEQTTMWTLSADRKTVGVAVPPPKPAGNAEPAHAP